MRRFLILLALLAWAPMATAQDEAEPSIDDDDGGRGYLTGLLEGFLTTDARDVRIDGFEGALSSRATIERIRVSDDQGVWLTLEGLVFDWDRSALFSRELAIQELSAERVIVARQPQSTATPEARSTDFAFPELPVSVQIDRVAIGTLEIGDPIIEGGAELSAQGSVTLDEGTGALSLSAERTDGARGVLDISASYDGETLSVGALFDEGGDGLAASALGIPGTPPVRLTMDGQGPVDDFAADIRLLTDGAERLSGTVGLRSFDEEDGETAVSQRFALDLSGDLAPLFAPQYAEFFGSSVALRVIADRSASGALRLQDLTLEAAAISLSGRARIASDGLPEAFDLRLRIEDPGEPVLLPLPAQVFVEGADLTATFDAAEGDRWTLEGSLDGVNTETLDLVRLDLSGGGTISRGPRRVTAKIEAGATGLRPADPALGTALGRDVILDLALDWEEGLPVTFERFSITGDGYSLAGDGQLLLTNLAVVGLAEARFEDLSRLSALAGRPLGGSLEASVEGRADLLGGGFDLRLTGEGRELRTEIEAADALLGGTADLVIDAVRNTEGTRIRLVSVETEALSAIVTGTYNDVDSRLSFDASLDDVGRVLPQISGPVTLVGTARQMNERWSVGLEAMAPSGSSATVFAVIPDDGRIAVDLDARVEDFTPFVPQLPGPGTVTASLEQIDGGWRVDAALDIEPGVAAEVRGAFVTEGIGRAEYSASIADLGAFDARLSGPLTFEGTALTQEGSVAAEAMLDGPGGLNGTVRVRQVPEAPTTLSLDLAADDPSALYPLPEPFADTGPVVVTGRASLGTERTIDLALEGPYGVDARLVGDLPVGEGLDGLDLSYDVTAPQVERLPYAPEGLSGPARARGIANSVQGLLRATLDLDGPNGIEADLAATREDDVLGLDYDIRVADVAGLPYVPEGLDGPARATGTARQDAARRSVTLDLDGPEGIAADIAASLPVDAQGLIGLEAEFDIVVEDLAALPGVPPEAGGRATATGSLSQDEGERRLDARLTAPLDIDATVTARQPAEAEGLEGLTASLDLTTGDLSALLNVPDAGRIVARGEIGVEDGTRRLRFEMDGPVGFDVAAEAALPAGSALDGLDGSFSATLPELARLPGVPEGLSGPASAAGTFGVDDGRARLDAALDGPVTGEIGISRALDAASLLDGLDTRFDLAAPDLSVFPGVPEALAGPAEARGRVVQSGETREIDVTLSAPLGIEATVMGSQPSDAAGIDGLTARIDARTGDLSPLLGLPEGTAGGALVTGRLDASGGDRRLTLDVDGPFGVTADVEADLPEEGLEGTRASFEARLSDIGRLPGVPAGYGGASTLTGTVTVDGDTALSARIDGPYGLAGEVEATIPPGMDGATASYDLRVPDLAAIPALPPALAGPARLTGTAENDAGAWSTDFGLLAPAGADLQGAAVIEGSTIIAGLSGTVADPGAIRPGVPGPITLEASLLVEEGDLSAQVDASTPGGDALRLDARVPANGEARVTFDAAVAHPEAFVPQISGPLTASGRATRSNGTWRVDVFARTGGGLAADVTATLEPNGDARVEADLALGDLGRFVRQLPGAASATVRARRVAGRWIVDVAARGPGLSGTVSANLPPSGEISGTFDVRLDRLDRFDDRLSGGVSARGTFAQAGSRIMLSVGLRGPGSLNARVSGSLARDFRSANLRASGVLPLELASPFIPPRLLSGDARFDVTLNGPLALRSVRGRVTTAGARLALPRFRQAVENITADIRLTGTEAQLAVSGNPTAGGSFTLTGPVRLSEGFPADLTLQLASIGIRDPQLYETTATGSLRIFGPLTGGGGTIAGQIDLAETEIRIPGSGFGGTGAIPVIDHLAAPLDVRETLARARLDEAASAPAVNRDGTPSRNFFNLDISVTASRRIFVRGRGLDAELGGSVQVRGTTRDIQPSGSFQLIRGRIDLLGRRLTLDEGTITLQGDFVPVVRLVASTRTEDGVVSVVVQGPLNEPEIRFESDTGLPQDEVVARLLFGQGLGSLTPLQAARLANAVAVLSGSGFSVVDNVRERLGLDNLDVVIDDDGEIGVTAGKYVTRDVYADVTLDEEGQAEVSITVDLTDDLTVRGSVNNEGESGLGVFFVRDY